MWSAYSSMSKSSTTHEIVPHFHLCGYAAQTHLDWTHSPHIHTSWNAAIYPASCHISTWVDMRSKWPRNKHQGCNSICVKLHGHLLFVHHLYLYFFAFTSFVARFNWCAAFSSSASNMSALLPLGLLCIDTFILCSRLWSHYLPIVDTGIAICSYCLACMSLYCL